MARYEQLNVSKEELYCPGSPVTICAEALLVDNKLKTKSAQVKFANVGVLAIDSLVAEYSPMAAMDRPLDPVVYQYRLDGAEPGSEFAQDDPVRLPDETVRYSSRVLRASFSDGSVWDSPDDAKWASVASQAESQEPLESAIGSSDLLEQYVISVSVSEGLTYVPMQVGNGSWVCGCGAINGPGRQTCISCKASLQEQLRHQDKDLLEREYADRLEEQRARDEKLAKLRAERAAREAEEAERKRLEDERLAQQAAATKKRNLRIVAVVAAVAIAAIGSFLAYSNIFLPKSKYDAARAMAGEGRYQEAIAEMDLLGDYSDAKQLSREYKLSYIAGSDKDDPLVFEYVFSMVKAGDKEANQLEEELYGDTLHLFDVQLVSDRPEGLVESEYTNDSLPGVYLKIRLAGNDEHNRIKINGGYEVTYVDSEKGEEHSGSHSINGGIDRYEYLKNADSDGWYYYEVYFPSTYVKSYIVTVEADVDGTKVSDGFSIE